MTRTNKNMYADFYDMAIDCLVSIYGSIRVLEIGCTLTLNKYGSGSSNAFSKMPFVEKYVGIDTIPPQYDFGEKTIFVHGDAYKPETIDKVKSLSDNYHLIIDDGPHGIHSQIEFFNLYNRFLAEKSFMVCEDVLAEEIQEIIESLKDPFMYSFISRYKKDKKILAEGDRRNLLVRFYSTGIGG